MMDGQELLCSYSSWHQEGEAGLLQSARAALPPKTQSQTPLQPLLEDEW